MKNKKKKTYMILGKKKPTKVMCRLIEMFYTVICMLTLIFDVL